MGRVGLKAVGGAFFAGRGVEGGEHGVHEGALPMSVDAAPVLIRAGGCHVFPLGEIEVRPVALGLVGLDGWAADVIVPEKPGDGEGVVADEFCIEAARRLLGEQAVVGIDLGELFVFRRDLAVAIRCDN